MILNSVKIYYIYTGISFFTLDVNKVPEFIKKDQSSLSLFIKKEGFTECPQILKTLLDTPGLRLDLPLAKDE